MIGTEALIDQLVLGIENNDFIPYFQPFVDTSKQIIIGGEVLIRWCHPQLGLISPNKFIFTAEDSGLIIPITEQLMSNVSFLFKNFCYHVPKGFIISFNLTERQLINSDIINACHFFLNELSEHNISLMLELIERDGFQCNNETVKLKIKTLKKIGVKLALDDFGIGYSKYNLLQFLDIDYIKIDKSFIQGVNNDKASNQIIESFNYLFNKLNIKIIAEGVEEKWQEDYLKEKGIIFQQGYRYGQPMKLESFLHKTFGNG